MRDCRNKHDDREIQERCHETVKPIFIDYEVVQVMDLLIKRNNEERDQIIKEFIERNERIQMIEQGTEDYEDQAAEARAKLPDHEKVLSGF